jgi:thiol-disulfide isomerase/thioredoxin
MQLTELHQRDARVVRVAALLLVLSSLAGTGLTGTAQAADGSGPVWSTDFYAAEKESRQQNRPMIVHFYGNSCGPCRQMDRETLYTPEVTRALEQGHIAVKVNISNHPELQQRFQVDAIPSDLFVAPDGKVLFHAQGFQSKGTYLIFVSRSRERLKRHEEAQGAVVARNVPFPGQGANGAAGADGDNLPPVPTDDSEETEETTRTARRVSPDTEDVAAARVGMDGFCPVTLFNKRSWKQGSPDFVVDYQDQTFYLTGADERDEFQRNPTKYAPKLRGCDPVLLSEKSEYVPGSAKYGAFFDGELFLFETEESRKKFKSDPSRFSKIQHVMDLEDTDKRRL